MRLWKPTLLATAIAASIYGGLVHAESCEMTLGGASGADLTFPCINFNGGRLKATLALDFAHTDLTNFNTAQWNLASLGYSTCSDDLAACVSLDSSMNMNVPLPTSGVKAMLQLVPTATPVAGAPVQVAWSADFVKSPLLTQSLFFQEASVAQSDAEKQGILATSSVAKSVPKAAPMTATIGYNTIVRGGDVLPLLNATGSPTTTTTFGMAHDMNGKPLFVSTYPDFNSLITSPSGKLFMVSQFEDRPASIYVSSVNQDATTGKLTLAATKPLDYSNVHGGWVHCAGSVSPWGTHLGSEEYEPNALLVDPTTGTKVTSVGGTTVDTYYHAMDAYFGGDRTKLNPYNYGHVTEVAITDDNGTATVVKHYAMGRISIELSNVMPDQKTAYITDDGTNVGLYMFIADTAKDLSAGNLYAMKWTQTSAANGGAANLTWVPLGHATDAEIRAFIDMGITFADLFDYATPDATGKCATGTSINAGHEAPFEQCLTLKTSNRLNMSAVDIEKAASRLETRRYAALKGATTELRKEEGQTYDPLNHTMYISMTEISSGMEDNMKAGKANTTYDIGGPNSIKLPANLCGAVYALDVGTDATIGSDYVAKNMHAEIVGKPMTYPAGTPLAGYTCDANGIANPDNITVIPQAHTLIIGEDTDAHQNDMVWAYNLDTKTLTRLQTTPYGSETTSVYFYPDIKGFAYIMSVVQHPYGESDQDKLPDADAARSYTGYIGPIPSSFFK